MRNAQLKSEKTFLSLSTVSWDPEQQSYAQRIKFDSWKRNFTYSGETGVELLPHCIESGGHTKRNETPNKKNEKKKKIWKLRIGNYEAVDKIKGSETIWSRLRSEGGCLWFGIHVRTSLTVEGTCNVTQLWGNSPDGPIVAQHLTTKLWCKTT